MKRSWKNRGSDDGAGCAVFFILFVVALIGYGYFDGEIMLLKRQAVELGYASYTAPTSTGKTEWKWNDHEMPRKVKETK